MRERGDKVLDGMRSKIRKRSAERRVARRAAEQEVVDLETEERLRERLTQQLTQQWAEGRAARKHEEPAIATGPSNFNRAQVPWAFDLAAAWAWRFVIISAALLAILWTLNYFIVIVLPLIVALFIAALVAPVVKAMTRVMPKQLAAMIVVIGGLASIALLLTFVGTQVANGATDLSNQVVDGLERIREWLRDGPLHASDSQVNDVIANIQDFVRERGPDLAGHVGEFGTAVGHVFAGIFIVLFSTYFFLADGPMIWAWIVRIFPRAARLKADASGRVAWDSLTKFVRATVLVAAVDAIGIVIVAAILRVPFLGAIGVLVFLGSFIPMVGSTVSGTVAVLVALVAHGPVVALFMLGGVILVQQIEAHVLQPFLMGRFVSVHPLGVIVAIAVGVLLAGITGALIAVPLAAVVNAVVQYLAGHTDIGDDALESASEDPGPNPELAAESREELAEKSGSNEETDL